MLMSTRRTGTESSRIANRHSSRRVFRAEAVANYRTPTAFGQPVRLQATLPVAWLWGALLAVVAASAYVVTAGVQSTLVTNVTEVSRCAHSVVALSFSPAPDASYQFVSMTIVDREFDGEDMTFVTGPFQCLQADGTVVQLGSKPDTSVVLLRSVGDFALRLETPVQMALVGDESLLSIVLRTSSRTRKLPLKSLSVAD